MRSNSALVPLLGLPPPVELAEEEVELVVVEEERLGRLGVRSEVENEKGVKVGRVEELLRKTAV